MFIKIMNINIPLVPSPFPHPEDELRRLRGSVWSREFYLWVVISTVLVMIHFFLFWIFQDRRSISITEFWVMAIFIALLIPVGVYFVVFFERHYRRRYRFALMNSSHPVVPRGGDLAIAFPIMLLCSCLSVYVPFLDALTEPMRNTFVLLAIYVCILVIYILYCHQVIRRVIF